MKSYFQIVLVVLGLGSITPAQVPADWTVNPPEFERVMTVTAVLKVNNQIANENSNVIAAFVGAECRGKAESLLTNGQQIYFLMIYGNTNGETVIFKTYYSPLDTVLNNSGSLLFDGSAAFGTPDNPYEIKATYPIVGISLENVPLEQTFNLKQNYPNPFNSATTIEYKIVEPGWVSLAIYDLNGNRVHNLVNEHQSSGKYTVNWQVLGLSSGVYYYYLLQNGRSMKRSCIYLK